MWFFNPYRFSRLRINLSDSFQMQHLKSKENTPARPSTINLRPVKADFYYYSLRQIHVYAKRYRHCSTGFRCLFLDWPSGTDRISINHTYCSGSSKISSRNLIHLVVNCRCFKLWGLPTEIFRTVFFARESSKKWRFWVFSKST